MRLHLLLTLRDSLSFGSTIFGGAVLGLVSVSQCGAQQLSGWSPQPFSKPNAAVANSSQNDVPPNSLRPTDGPQESQNGAVLRWGVSNKELRHSREDKSFAQALAPEGNQQPSESRGMVVASKANSGSNASASARPTLSEPRSGFEISGNRVDRVPSVQLASHNEVTISVPSQDGRTSGVWYDRSTGNSGNASKSSYPQPDNSRPISSGSRIDRQTDGRISVQNVRFQDQQTDLPPAENPIPRRMAPDSLLDRDSSRALNEVLDKLPPSSQPLSNKPGRSLLEPEQIPPNPFPGSKSTKSNDDDRSPSDANEPPSLNSMKDSDAAPAPPRRLDRSVVDCDSVRLLAKESDITKIRIDSSPSFVEGYKSKNRSAANTKESFIENAPSRTWLSYEGQVVAEGKLVDLKLGSVIIERANGSRTSYLLHKLSDADQVYVSEKWGLPVTCSIDDRSFPRRDFVDTTVTWKASGACHKPLYFEDVQLERYGHEWGPFAQPVISTAHFFGDVLVLPYKVGIHPMNECQYSLGYYRPGSCAPWTIGPVPVSLRGAWLQAKVVTGAALVLP